MKNFKAIQLILLTIIAISLIGIFIQNQLIITRLNLQSTNNTIPIVKKVSFDSDQNYTLVPVNKDGSIDVNIKSISDVVDVNIDEVGGYNTYGTIEVKVK